MNLHQLKYAVEVDRHKSITRAAKSLFVSQPAVSTAIRELEDELKIRIFSRTSSGVETTETGRVFIADALDILQRAETLGRRYGAEPSMNTACTLSVAGPPADSSVSALISVANKCRCGGFRLSYKNQLVFDVIDSVEKGSVDIGLLSFKSNFSQTIMTVLEQKSMEYHHISAFPLCLAVCENHPLASAFSEGRLTHEQLCRYPIVYMDSDFRENTLHAIALALGAREDDQAEQLKSIQVVDLCSLIRIMREANAVTAICEWPFAGEATDGCGIVRLNGSLGGLTEQRGWIKRRDRVLPDCADDFISHVEEYFANLNRDR